MTLANLVKRRVASSGGGTPLLDAFPGAKSGYSVRKLRAAYAGASMRVRRSSDNTEQDIGFDGNGDLDTAALLSFCGAGDGFVRTWYDQANTFNIGITTQSQQAKIVSAGTLLTMSGIVSSSGVIAMTGYNLSYASGRQKCLVFAGDTTPFLGIGPSNSSRMATSYAGSGAVSNELLFDAFGSPPSTARVIDGGSTASATHTMGEHIMVVTRTLTDLTLREDGSQIATASVGSAIGSSAVKLYEEGGSKLSEAPRRLSEFIFYDSDQTANLAGIEANVNAYYGVY